MRRKSLTTPSLSIQQPASPVRDDPAISVTIVAKGIFAAQPMIWKIYLMLATHRAGHDPGLKE